MVYGFYFSVTLFRKEQELATVPSIVIYTMLLRVYNVVLEHYKLARITRENLATGLKGVTTFYVYVKFN